MGLILRSWKIRKTVVHVRWYQVLGLRGRSTWLIWKLGRQRRGQRLLNNRAVGSEGSRESVWAMRDHQRIMVRLRGCPMRGKRWGSRLDTV